MKDADRFDALPLPAPAEDAQAAEQHAEDHPNDPIVALHKVEQSERKETDPQDGESPLLYLIHRHATTLADVRSLSLAQRNTMIPISSAEEGRRRV